MSLLKFIFDFDADFILGTQIMMFRKSVYRRKMDLKYPLSPHMFFAMSVVIWQS